MKKTARSLTLIAMTLIVITVCMFTINSSYSWYLAETSVEEDLIIRADGFTYINLEVPTDALEDGSDRYISPAVALPHAVNQGLYTDVLKTYEETKDSSLPSYVLKAAVPKTFTTSVSLYQDEGQTSMLSYDLWTIADNLQGAKVYGKNEFVFSEVSFYYYDTTTTLDENGEAVETSELVNPLENDPRCYQAEDKSSGLMCIVGSQNIFITITLYFANVDELIDDEFFKHDSFWITLALAIRP